MPDSSTDCFPCRLEWRPSPFAAWGAAALVMLVALSLLATQAAEALPAAVQVAVALLAAPAAGLARQRVLAAAPGVLALRIAGAADATTSRNARRRPEACWMPANGRGAAGPAVLHEQWPVVVLRFTPGDCTVVFWPDTLCDSGRRALRRWAGATPDASPITQFWTG